MANGNRIVRRVVWPLVLALLITSGPAHAGYTPAELNPLLGRPVLMDAMTCQKKYGADFCACMTLEDGTNACYYQRPAAGFYTLARCEEIWGAGHCECPTADQCRLKDTSDESKTLGCSGQILIFPGAKDECSKPGIMTAGRNCCFEQSETSNACGFENVAETLGWDSAAIELVKMAGGYFAKKAISDYAAKVAVEQAIQSGAFDFATSSIGAMFGSGAPVIYSVEGGASFAIEMGGEKILAESTQQAVSLISEAYMTAFTWVGWAYTIYSMYNMYDQMTQCTAGEKLLGCKRAKGTCHEVGSRCTMKIFGQCLQEKKVFCCFDTILARIVQEQGRPQLGRGWGSAKSPDCRGFYVDEFAQIDFSKIDMSEYVDDITRQMLDNTKIQDKITKTVEKWRTDDTGN